MSENKKWYGLTISKKAAKVNTKGKSIFESDDSDGNVEDHIKARKETSSKEKKKKTPQSKPDEIDPNIYEYDSIYDEMKASQKQKVSHTKSKEPRYINLLLKAAEKRKKENVRRVERKIQAERVKEGDEFKDKDAFVTSAYRQKMIEMEEEEERERKESALEEMMDSTKQKDLGGFYRHFLKQTVGEEKVPEFGERDAKVSGTAKKKQDYSETDKSRQRSESPSEIRSGAKHSSPEKKNYRSDTKPESEKLHKSGDPLSKSETKDGKNGTPSENTGHPKNKASSHKSKSRPRSSSPSDSEGRKHKKSVEKSHKKKYDSSIFGSKYIHDEKPKSSHNSKNQEDKTHDRARSGHHTSVKQASSSEKYDNCSSPNKVDQLTQRPKLDRGREECKKDLKTHHRTEKRSLQTSSKSASGDQSHDNDKRSSDNKNRADHLKSKHGSDYDHDSEIRRHSDSKKRESKSSDGNSDSKRRKYDDEDTSSTSSEDEVKNQKSEGKDVPETPKTDMLAKFAKRTVGKIFDDAQARYFKRRDAAKAMN